MNHIIDVNSLGETLRTLKLRWIEPLFFKNSGIKSIPILLMSPLIGSCFNTFRNLLIFFKSSEYGLETCLLARKFAKNIKHILIKLKIPTIKFTFFP